MIVVESKQDHCLFSPREVGFDLIRDFLIMEAFTTKKNQCELRKERRAIYLLPNDTRKVVISCIITNETV